MMPNGPTAFLRFDVEEFASFLKALPVEGEAGVAFATSDRDGRPLSAVEMLQLVLSEKREHVLVEEQYGSYYIVHLPGCFDPSEGTKRYYIGVYESSPLFMAIRKRHHSSDHP